MPDERYSLSAEEGIQLQQALDISAMNGLIDVAITLAKHGLMTPEEIEHMHQGMSKPLQLPHVANNRGIQDAQHHLDTLFAEVRRFATHGPLPPE